MAPPPPDARRRRGPLTAQVLAAHDSLRHSVSRELHDLLGQQITAVGLHLEIISTHLTDPHPSVLNALRNSAQLLHEASKSLRTYIYLLHPPELDLIGLPAAIREFARQLSARTGWPITVETSVDARRLPKDISLHLLRITQEALWNAFRHAASTRADVALRTNSRHITLTISDDGQGFSPARAKQSPEAHFGLASMRARAKTVGATLRLTSGASGTTIAVTVPLRGHTSRGKPLRAATRAPTTPNDQG